MSERFTADFFADNRQKLTKLFTGSAPIILTANGLLQRNADNTLPFRQDSSFWYLTGIQEPDIIVVMDKGKDYLILPETSEYQTVMETNLKPDDLVKISGIKDIMSYQAGWKQLSGRLKRIRHVATLGALPDYVSHYGFYSNPARANLIKKIEASNQAIEFLDLKPQLTAMRVIKQPEELKALQGAIDVTCQTLREIKSKFSKYQYEYQVEADISRAYRQSNAVHGFAPIVAGSLNATTPHYIANRDPLKSKSLVVIDTGAEVDNYSADITRTYSTTEPNKRQKDIFNGVAAVQQYAVDLIKPGLTIKQLEEKVEQYMGEKLRELGLIKIIERQTVRQYYPHNVSHFLGLDVHDTGNYEQPLEPNMVITVEPGIYIGKEKIGVRIEDDVLITNNGAKVLSQKAPKQLW